MSGGNTGSNWISPLFACLQSIARLIRDGNIGVVKPMQSAYRNPVRNFRVGGARQSRHMYGDAADLQNQARTQAEYNSSAQAARNALASYIEPLNGPCGFGCVHADWRNYGGGYR